MSPQSVSVNLQAMMSDPVVIEDGSTFERLNIQRWFGQRVRPNSPLTGARVVDPRIQIPSHVLRSIIALYHKYSGPVTEEGVD